MQTSWLLSVCSYIYSLIPTVAITIVPDSICVTITQTVVSIIEAYDRDCIVTSYTVRNIYVL